MKNNILRIVKEDILEVIGREGKKVSLFSVEPEIKVSREFIFEAIKELEKENLVQVKQNSIFLTKEGINQAKNAIKKHSILENYFKKTENKENAWKAASILEHYVSVEVVDNIKKLSTFKKEGVILTESKKKQGLITNIVFNNRLFERIVSMGIFPGEKIEIKNNLTNVIVIKVGNKKFALAKKLAKKIKMTNNE